MTAPAVGIDLGTTYSCVAVFRNGSVEVIPNELGNRTMPSVVAFVDKRRLVGEAAKDQDYQNPENTVYDAKRLIGRKFDDKNVQEDRKNWPFEVVNDGGRPKIRVNHGGEAKTFYPEQISAMVLGALKTAAESHLGAEVTQCVVTVPAHFGDAQRQATRDAAVIAGLSVLRIINEPTAGALAYGLSSDDGDELNVLIYDFGGGTFDVSVLTIDEGIFEVRATRGDTHLGGEDLDARLLTHLADEFTRKHPGLDIRADSKAMRRLRTACEKAKRQLSAATDCSVQLDNLHAGKDFATTLTRACFEQLNKDLFQATITCVRSALSDCGLAPKQIARVVLVGGSSRIPRVQRLLRELFGGRELDHSVSPDEAVARGAAVQAAILDGDPSDMIQDMVLVDITPISLGKSISGGRTSRVIKKNTVIPTKKTRTYYTVSDYQTSVGVKIVEGERAMVKDNNELGSFRVEGIPPARAGAEPIDYTFEIDADGILHVSAVVRSNKRQVNLTVTSEKGRLRPDQIEKMKRDAEIFKEEDKRQREIAGAKATLEHYCRNMNSRARRSSDISKSVREKIEMKCGETLEWLESHQSYTKELLERKLHEMKWICHQLE